MRAVSSATWTSVEPVSLESRPYLSTISRLASVVRVTAANRSSGLAATSN